MALFCDENAFTPIFVRSMNDFPKHLDELKNGKTSPEFYSCLTFLKSVAPKYLYRSGRDFLDSVINFSLGIDKILTRNGELDNEERNNLDKVIESYRNFFKIE